MISCQLKAITSDRAVKQVKPIKAMQKVQDPGKRHHAERNTHSCLPLSPLVNKLSKAGLPCCSYLSNLRSLTHYWPLIDGREHIPCNLMPCTAFKYPVNPLFRDQTRYTVHIWAAA
jgi:hypothetical protein